MYSLFKPIVFALDPERAHDLTLSNLEFISKRQFLTSKLAKFYSDCIPDMPVHCMNLDFKHPIGLAAGLDKDARAYAAFSSLGFSAVELGTVTPQPQPGNEKPRMFRLLEDEAIINRMGFNSGGVEQFLDNFKANAQCQAIAGINIGKNAATPIEDAHVDYVSALQRVYSLADYVTINISSPNTKSLRDLQNESYLDNLLSQIKKAHVKCAKVHKKHIPIALKVAPDLTTDEIEVISELLISHQFDGLIATNTTVARPDSLLSEHAAETGGLSGSPVKGKSTECIKEFYRHLKGRVQIIGVGGIKNADDAWEKLLAGADYLQIYSLFIYQGPAMIKEIVTGLHDKIRQHGFDDLSDALQALR